MFSSRSFLPYTAVLVQFIGMVFGINSTYMAAVSARFERSGKFAAIAEQRVPHPSPDRFDFLNRPFQAGLERRRDERTMIEPCVVYEVPGVTSYYWLRTGSDKATSTTTGFVGTGSCSLSP
jgi:hypothetical protein